MIRPAAEVPVAIRSMRHDDIAEVSDIERRSYDFPWSHGVFRDCLLAGYHCMVLVRASGVAGYAILSIAAGEAHVLNLCVDPAFRELGYGEAEIGAASLTVTDVPGGDVVFGPAYQKTEAPGRSAGPGPRLRGTRGISRGAAVESPRNCAIRKEGIPADCTASGLLPGPAWP